MHDVSSITTVILMDIHFFQLVIGIVIMSTLVTLWVATIQFLKAMFTPQSPVFFGFNGTRIQMEDEYIIAREADTKTFPTQIASSIENGGTQSSTSAARGHRSTMPR